ncbi:MAG: hypothetical protein GXP03_11645 [Alphaproteobacteria bacterium]|nr:hypothetical protein [Alphaproteobacteria bacterium]
MKWLTSYVVCAALLGADAVSATSFSPEGLKEFYGPSISSPEGLWRKGGYCYARIYNAYESDFSDVFAPAYRIFLSQFQRQMKVAVTVVLSNGQTMNFRGNCRLDGNPKWGNVVCELDDCASCNVVVHKATENIVTLSARSLKLWDSERTKSFVLSSPDQQRLQLEAYRTLESACWE